MSFSLGTIAAAVGLGTAGGLVSSVYNNYANKKAASKQYGYEQSLMDYQNQWNLEQWNRENEYNSPKSIMARYQEAGLNPNLIYGNSYASPAHLESATGHAPQVRSSDLQLNLAHNLLSAYNLEAQNQLLEAQKKEVEARTGLINTQNVNWTHDHANWQRELIDLVRGVLGGNRPGQILDNVIRRLQGKPGSYSDSGNEVSDKILDSILGSYIDRFLPKFY